MSERASRCLPTARAAGVRVIVCVDLVRVDPDHVVTVTTMCIEEAFLMLRFTLHILCGGLWIPLQSLHSAPFSVAF